MTNIGKTKYTSQYIDNMTFDDDFQVKTVEVLEYNGTDLVRKVNDPTDGYNLANLDIVTDPMYFGYINSNGEWYIRKIYFDTTAVTYIKGTTNYAANWTGRVALSYDTYDNIW